MIVNFRDNYVIFNRVTACKTRILPKYENSIFTHYFDEILKLLNKLLKKTMILPNLIHY